MRPSKEELVTMYDSGLAQTQIATSLGVWSSTVSKWMRAYGIAPGKGINRFPNHGESAGMWKGNAASYSAFHHRLTTVRGKPRLCENCKTTTAKKFEWANLTGAYHDTNDYIRLCVSCHRYMDGHGRGEKNGRWKGGPPEFKCIHCGKTFRRYRNPRESQKFCSISCAGKNYSARLQEAKRARPCDCIEREVCTAQR